MNLPSLFCQADRSGRPDIHTREFWDTSMTSHHHQQPPSPHNLHPQAVMSRIRLCTHPGIFRCLMIPSASHGALSVFCNSFDNEVRMQQCTDNATGKWGRRLCNFSLLTGMLVPTDSLASGIQQENANRERRWRKMRRRRWRRRKMRRDKKRRKSCKPTAHTVERKKFVSYLAS